MSDIIVIGRELLRNTYFPINAAHTLNAEIDWPKQYLKAKK